MKKMAKVLLVICSLILGLCGCGEKTEVVETTETVPPEVNLEGTAYIYTTKLNVYMQFMYTADAKGYEIVHTTNDVNDKLDCVEYEVWYRVPEDNSQEEETRIEEISRYHVRTYESFEEYEEDSVLKENLKTGKYEIQSEAIDDSGKYVLTLKENFEAVKSENAEDEYTIAVSDDEYLVVIRWLLEELGYDIVKITVDDSDNECTYLITYNKAEATPTILNQNTQYIMYGVDRCTAPEVEGRRAGLLENGYEIIGESANTESGTYFITYRLMLQYN